MGETRGEPGITPITALTDVRNGAAFRDPLGGTAAAAAREVACAAGASGVDLTGTDGAEATARVARATAANRSSMAQELAANGRTEVDLINCYVVEQIGAQPAPVNRTFAALVRARKDIRD